MRQGRMIFRQKQSENGGTTNLSAKIDDIIYKPLKLEKIWGKKKVQLKF
jgi:hypothetical protein